MAVEQVTGATPAWFVEYDAAPSRILAHHWPDVPNHGDVTKVDWSAMPPVDIITGGSPCQDLSAAGKRAGMTEGTRSNLWVNMREAIRIIRPRLVVWENVQGALSAKAASDSDLEPGARPLGNQPGGHLRALGRVLGDLSEIGYDARWTTLRASDVGAPHHRARVFLIAWQGATDPGHEPGRGWATDDSGAASAGPHGIRVQRRDGNGPRSGESGQDATDTDGVGWGEGAEQPIAGPPEVTAPVGSEPPAATDFGPYTEAVQRWERLTRPAPAPTELNTKGNPRLNAEFASWMMGLPEGHVTQVPGISRADQLRAIGNGVCVPQGIAAIHQLLTSPAPAGHFS